MFKIFFQKIFIIFSKKLKKLLKNCWPYFIGKKNYFIFCNFRNYFYFHSLIYSLRFVPNLKTKRYFEKKIFLVVNAAFSFPHFFQQIPFFYPLQNPFLVFQFKALTRLNTLFVIIHTLLKGLYFLNIFCLLSIF